MRTVEGMPWIRPRLTLLAAAVALSVGASGCAAPPVGAPITPTESSSDAPLQSLTPTPTDPPVSADDEDVTDPATWVIDDGVLGPIRLGAAFDDTLDELPEGWDAVPGCEGVAAWAGEDAGFDVYFVDGSAGIESIVVEGTLGDPAGGPRTPVGVGLGSTRDEVLAAYPTASDVPATVGDATYLRLTDDDPSDGAAFFEVPAGDDRVASIALAVRDEPPYEPCA